MAKTFKYKDCVVAASSELGKALEEKKDLHAQKVYWECEVEFQKHVQGTEWAKPRGLAENELMKVLAKLAKLQKEAFNKAKSS